MTLVLGVDFGTDSIRCVVADTRTANQVAVGEAAYVRWAQGRYCDANQTRFRQHPRDHMEAFELAAVEALEQLSARERNEIRAVGVDSTGSTPVAVDARGKPLAYQRRFADDPSAQFFLWKDHTATAEAEQITKLARTWGGDDFTKYSGGAYSPEWFWAKLLRFAHESPAGIQATVSWVELCDWITAELTGVAAAGNIVRSRCAAGHKAMWHSSWGGYPSREFLGRLHPELPRVATSLPSATRTADQRAGTLSSAWRDRLGLNSEVVVACGILDAHAGAIGGGVRSNVLLKVIGTSTCDMLVAQRDSAAEPIPGIAGEVDGSIIPGLTGLEAGQSAFGDIYAWFRNLLLWPFQQVVDDTRLRHTVENRVLDALATHAQRMAQPELNAVDWWNGRRSPSVDMTLRGAMTGLSLGTDAPAFFQALVHATAYGSRRILEHLRAHGIAIDQVIAVGGIANKSPYVMQILADCLGLPIHVAQSEQACALGSAMNAATALGAHSSLLEAQSRMVPPGAKTYTPDTAAAGNANEGYRRYLALGEFVEQESQHDTTDVSG